MEETGVRKISCFGMKIEDAGDRSIIPILIYNPSLNDHRL
jgi:hypothetical protein